MGSSNGIQFATSVTVSGLSGLVNAYTSVLSAFGSPAISGASRWLEAVADGGGQSAEGAGGHQGERAEAGQNAFDPARGDPPVR